MKKTLKGSKHPPAPVAESGIFKLTAWAKAAWIIPYLSALVWWRDSVPDGLNNDAVEEALRGLYLVGERKFEVMTFVIGHSAETLYLYLVGLAATWLGPTTLAIQLPSWAFALATIWLLCLAARRLEAALPLWVPLLLGVSSVWLFHYARSGLRAISSAFFFLLFGLLLERAERLKEERWTALLAGAALGLSLYAYTSCRLLPLIFLFYAGLRLALERQARRALLGCYGKVIVGGLMVSIPNLLFLLSHPQEFFARGNYSMPQEISVIALGPFWSFLIPFYFPYHLTSEFYQIVYATDSVSNGLVIAGLNPVHPIVAVAFLAGLIQACRVWRKPGALFLLIAWLVETMALGIAGPSLTRFLMLLPVYLLLASLGIAEGLRRWPRARALFIVLLLLALGTHAYRYFTVVESSLYSKFYASMFATPMGKRAAALAAENQRVICVVSKDANIIRYLTHMRASNVRVTEFYFRPLVAKEIPLAEFKPTILLIEKNRAFADFTATLRGNSLTQNERFVEIALPKPQ